MNPLLVVNSAEGKAVILADISVGVPCAAWVLYGAVFTFRVALAYEPASVRYGLAGTFSLAASIVAVESSAGSYFWDGTWLYVRAAAGSIFDQVVLAMVVLRFSMPQPKNLNAHQYLPRIKSLPNISQRIEQYFGGVAQIGGGDIGLCNGDKFFDDKRAWAWDVGSVDFSFAMDTQFDEAIAADFIPLSSWAVTSTQFNRQDFVIKLIEKKGRIQSSFPVGNFTRDDWPNIEESNVGKLIPTAYGTIFGVAPVAVDPGNKKFKLASHAISSINAVRKRVETSQSYTEKLPQWELFDADWYIQRTYVPSFDVKSIAAPLHGIVQVEKIEDFHASLGAQRWAQIEGWLYVQCAIPGLGVLEYPETLDVTYEVKNESWQPIAFSNVDLANATFTLGADFAVGEDISVDFTGKPDAAGLAIESPPEVIRDILETSGDTGIDGAIFDATAEDFVVGYDGGMPVVTRALSLYLTQAEDIVDLIGRINKFASTYVYITSAGLYGCKTFVPLPGGLTIELDESSIIDFSEVDDNEKLITQTQARYAINEAEKLRQTEEHNHEDLQIAHGQPNPVNEDLDTPFARRDDALGFAQEYSLIRGRTLQKFSITTKFIGLYLATLGPGFPVAITLPTRNVNGTFEILESRLDLVGMTQTFVLGNYRGYGDSVAWWGDDADVLPATFAGLAGYGTGSLDWNDSWDPIIKRYARLNQGYWTDDNGFASTTDAASYNASVMI